MEPPSIRQFIKIFTSHWLSICSGAVSVPFAAYGAYVASAPAQVLFTCLAILAFSVASYQVWKDEREAHVATNRLLDAEKATAEQLRTDVDAARDRRPRPHLYLATTTNSYMHGGEDGFVVENQGDASAVGVSISMGKINDLELSWVARGPIHAGKQSNVYIAVGEEFDLSRTQVLDLVRKATSELLPSRELKIIYSDTDRRSFIVFYDVFFNPSNGVISPHFRSTHVMEPLDKLFKSPSSASEG